MNPMSYARHTLGWETWRATRVDVDREAWIAARCHGMPANQGMGRTD
jgi:hypothetical protein